MRDTSILSGKYDWVWEEEENALSQVDPTKLQTQIANTKAKGNRGQIVKAGDGVNIWPQFAASVKAIKDAGLAAAAWTYCYGDNPQAEAQVAMQALANGADFLVLDVELEYAGKAQAAQTMGTLIRAKYPDALIAFAPFCFPQNPHFANYPWSEQWGQIPHAQFLPWVDAIMPQVYWGDWPPKVDVGLKTMDEQIKPWGKPIYPVGQTYTSASGFTPSASDYALFEQTCHALGYTGVSFWRAGTTDSNMQAAIAKMNFPIVYPETGHSLPYSVAAGQKNIDWLQKLYQISKPGVQKAAHWLNDQYRVALGMIRQEDACKDTSFTADDAEVVIKDQQTEFSASPDPEVRAAAHWGADVIRALKGIPA